MFLGNNVIIMKKGRIYALLAVLMVSAFAAVPSAVTANQKEGFFSYGVGSLCVDLDPHQAWDSASIDVIDQVCEGLFGYDLSDPELAIVPVLATAMGTWNDDADEYTVTLKSGVTFHDGSAFTADDVVYSFDRLASLIDEGESQIAELYEPLNSQLVINETVKVSDTEVRFVLNYAYVPFVPLLCFAGSVILPSDAGYSTTELMDTATADLIGTGPFDYISQSETQTELQKFANWHGTWGTGEGSLGNYDKIYFILYEDDDAKQNAFLSGQLDWLDGASYDYLEEYNKSTDINIGEERQGTVILYMGMNNKLIDVDIRKAISYAFNYDYVIDELALGHAARLTSPVPEGIMYHHPDLDFPTYDVETAREIMETKFSLVEGVGGYTNTSDDDWWYTKAQVSPLAEFNFTWNSGNSFRADLGLLTRANLQQIGIKTELCPMTWAEYLTRLLGDFDKLELYSIGWGPDYNDPSNFINPLFSNTSSSNGAQVNDPWLQEKMMEALTITDAGDRQDAYYAIQEYIVETLYPWVFLYVPLSVGVTRDTVAGVQRNPMGKLYFASMYWVEGSGSTGGGIPGYGLLALLGAASFAILAIVYKKRH
jgi:peptide/nickel transport system substrate-binding protein